jgi:hypothetical protein
MSKQRKFHEYPSQEQNNSCQVLLPRHVQMIDEALRSLGEFGEVRLVVEKGRLRFLVTQKSYDTYKWHPGAIVRDIEE